MTVLERALRAVVMQGFDGFLSGEEIWMGLLAPVEAVDYYIYSGLVKSLIRKGDKYLFLRLHRALPRVC